MKKLLYAFIGMTLIASCSKDQNISPPESQQKMVTLSAVDQNGDITHQLTVPFKQPEQTEYSNPKTNSLQAAGPHINGHFTTGNGTTVSMAGMMNNGGIHGNVNFFGTFDFKISTTCVEVYGNQGMIGGQVTHIKNLPPIISVGDYIYILVEDNGNGPQAASDEYSYTFYYSPQADGPLCALLTPNSGNWDEEWMEPVINASDNIQVSP